MGAFRLRFTPAEREAFTVGVEVQWLDATRWKSGVIAGPVEVETGLGTDPNRPQFLIPVENKTAGRGFVRLGEVVKVMPKHVRVPVVK